MQPLVGPQPGRVRAHIITSGLLQVVQAGATRSRGAMTHSTQMGTSTSALDECPWPEPSRVRSGSHSLDV